jgi:hypothetical protein
VIETGDGPDDGSGDGPDDRRVTVTEGECERLRRQ